MRVAAIDIGTNSTRVLVADVDGERISELFRHSIVTRLGDRVDQMGRLADDARQRVFDVLAGYRDEYVKAGAERVGGVATSAVRDSANGAEFVAEIDRRYGIAIDLIDGDREAQLTFTGACSGDAVGGTPTVVVDIGGGSTEFITGVAGRLDHHVSTNIGAVRHSERFLTTDPPTAEQLEVLIDSVTAEIREVVPADERERVRRGVGVAGTPTVLASVDQQLEHFDPWKVHGYAITRDACERLLHELAALKLADRREVTGLHPDRAPTIVAGAAILLATMREFALDEVTVSEHDILYGIALGLARG
ncbi:MAG: Ppx/GppA family phosphatase [Actinobacteria bacterium]|nr:Ppx/GppA family phosphatase [Actinomycetota bacterium]